MTVGRRIRELRQQKDWSLAELAKRSGVALSSLSRMETGKMTGTLESHLVVARALGVRLTELYLGLDGAPLMELRRADQAADKVQGEKGAGFTLLSRSGMQNKMLPTLLSLAPKASTQRERGAAGAEKFLYLLKGEMEVATGSEKAKLKPGDSLYFLASSSYSITNSGGQAALALLISTPAHL